MSNTIAASLADEYNNDGENIYNGDGVRIYDRCNALCHYKETSGESTRYIFQDGSVLVIGWSAWDIEGDQPFSFETQ